MGRRGMAPVHRTGRPVPRLVTVSFEVTYSGAFGEGWINPMVVGHGERRRAAAPSTPGPVTPATHEEAPPSRCPLALR